MPKVKVMLGVALQMPGRSASTMRLLNAVREFFAAHDPAALFVFVEIGEALRVAAMLAERLTQAHRIAGTVAPIFPTAFEVERAERARRDAANESVFGSMAARGAYDPMEHEG